MNENGNSENNMVKPETMNGTVENNTVKSETMNETVENNTVKPEMMNSKLNINEDNQNDSTNNIEKKETLNKEEIMEEALSHTNQFTPFEAPKQEINVEKKQTKSPYLFLGIVFVILFLFILFLPKFAALFGWQY